MPHRFVEHVGEVELSLEAEGEAELFAEATAAFRELVDGGRSRGDARRHEISLGPEKPELLLVDWLNELVFLAEVDAFVPRRVAGIELADERLHATVEGTRGWPRHLVKGATLHGLELAHEGEVWHARVVLDV